ncbi:MAG: pyridoxamine 5'-phosphate oxidase family protein [Actinomycetota bacterium]|nr:pyridoxamine 5'-phosphate oxidase family protein [Actinomycetota bacterium]
MSDDMDALRRGFRDVPACRIGTVRPDGGPHVSTRWFVWREDGLWVSTRIGGTTWDHASRDPRVSIVIDRGTLWSEQSGLRVEGVAESMPAAHPDLREPMSAWHEKYRTMLAGDGFERMAAQVPELGFLHVVPGRVDAWDHR